MRLSRLMRVSCLAILVGLSMPLTEQGQWVALAQSQASQPVATPLRIGGGSATGLTQRLESGFSTQPSALPVTTQGLETDAALQALQRNEVDLALVGRPLTAAEQAQGLTAVPVHGEKIAVVIGADNPFADSLTVYQLVDILQGRLTDWSALGRAAGPIQLVDWPEDSDLRRSLLSYPAFQGVSQTLPATAVETADLPDFLQALGENGIGFAIASQVSQRSDVKLVPIHQTLPTDLRYPFSQVWSYVYQGQPTPTMQAFLDYATGPEGQAALAGLSPRPNRQASPPAPPSGLAVTSPDGALTARVTPAGEIVVTDGQNQARFLETSVSSVTALTFSPDGQYLAVGGADGAVQWVPLESVRSQVGRITALAISPDNQQLAVGNAQGVIHLWDLNGRDLTESFTAATAEDLNLAFTEDGQALLVTTAAGTQRWDWAAAASQRPGSHSVWSAPWLQTWLRWQWLLPSALFGFLLAIFWYERRSEQPRQATAEPVLLPAAEGIPIGSGIAEAEATAEPSTAMDLLLARAQAVIDRDRHWASRPVETSAAVPTAPSADIPTAIREPLARSGSQSLNQPPPSTGEKSRTNGTPPAPDVDLAGLSTLVWAPVTDQAAESAAGWEVDHSRLVLMPWDEAAAYAAWDIPEAQKTALKRQGGEMLALRLYDVTDVAPHAPLPTAVRQFICDELSQSWDIPLPSCDRDYLLEIGYLTADQHWLLLARSLPVYMPAVASLE